MKTDNPLLNPYDVPPLDKIKTEHFEPAIDQAIEEAGKKFAALKSETSAPDFANTVVPLDLLFIDIVRIQLVMDTFMGASYSDELVAAEERISKKISAFKKTVYQDEALAKRFKAVAKPSNAEDKTLYKNLSLTFEGEGAFLPPEGQKRIKAIDDKLIGLCSAFVDNLNKGTKQQAVLFTNIEDIAGLPEATVSALRKNAQDAGHKTGWMVIPERLQVDMLLEIAENQNFRQKIFEALSRVGTQLPYDNEPITKDIQKLRHERATMLGYSDYAAYALARTMAGSVPRVNAFMDAVTEKALPKFEESVRTIQAFAANNGGPRTLKPWDLSHWANRYRQKMFDFDANKFSEYLPLDNVTNGFFKTAERIFDVTFHENKTYPRYHDDVRTYDVTDNKTGAPVGIVYADFFARDDSKRGAAWMSQMQQKLPGHPNIVTLNMNLLKPAVDKPTLLSLDEMSTLFHEGGHALHGLLGTNTTHPSLQGPAGAADYAEFFSTVMENWPNQKECLDSFARHFKTGEVLPDDLFEKMERSQNFFAERDVLKVIQNSRRDFAFHTMDPANYTTSKALEQSADFQHPFADHIRSYPLNRWQHPFSSALSDYAAGYYGYDWSKGLAALGYEPFDKKGAFDPDSCQRLAKLFSYGVSREGNHAFEECHGDSLTTDAMANALLKSIGADRSPRVSLAGSRVALG